MLYILTSVENHVFKKLINLAIYRPLLLKIYKYLSSFKGSETRKKIEDAISHSFQVQASTEVKIKLHFHTHFSFMNMPFT